MSKWRQLALELFPDERVKFQRNDTDIYQVFFALLAHAQDPHLQNDVEKLERIYQYAEWCIKQEKHDPNIYSAALVSFYEHLGYEDLTYYAIPYRIKPALFELIMPVLW